MIDHSPTAAAQLLLNEHRTAMRTPPPDGQAARFHRRLPGYAETPLLAAPALALRLGVAHVWLKDETERLGLPSFKALGATWAIARLLADRLALPIDDPSLERLHQALRTTPRPVLVAATDGNHGRAVARTATLLGLASHILVPAATARARVDAIRGEGARVQEVDGDYEQAVGVAAALGDGEHLVVADTSWPGYEQVPAWIVDGYDTMLDELDRQLQAAGAVRPDLVVVPVGVGSLAAAVIGRLRSTPQPGRVMTVEPHGAACLMASLEVGRPVTLTGVHDSIMAGLNCNTPSPSVWPLLRDGVDASCSIADQDALRGIRALADAGVDAGACAGGAVGALLALLADADDRGAHRAALGLDETSSVVALLTEGPTDAALEHELIQGLR